MTTHRPGRFRGPVSSACRWRAPVSRRPVDGRDANVRKELVDRVRAEIATGAYDTPERLANALDRLCRQLPMD